MATGNGLTFDESPLARLVSPVGLVSGIKSGFPLRGCPRVCAAKASVGSGFPDVTREGWDGSDGASRVLDDVELSYVVATAEAAERYMGRIDFDEPVWGTADELPGDVMDMNRIPRLSERELAHEHCSIRHYDPKSRIRWTRGLNLMTGKSTWVPLVMACYGVPAHDEERFVYRISTGFSVHSDPYAAILGGVMEIVERDAIALTWLQKLPLPPLSPECITADARELLDWAERHFLPTRLFNATLDLGIPTVYAFQIAPHDPAVRQIIGAGTGHTLEEAAQRCLLELLTSRQCYHSDGELPEADAFADFAVLDGARVMARPEQGEAFSFLTDDLESRRPSAAADPLPGAPAQALAEVLRRLEAAQMHAYVVDRTTRELEVAGLTGVAVIVPELHPMSLDPLLQFRGHPRLALAPKLMGFESLPEEEQNPWPIPFT